MRHAALLLISMISNPGSTGVLLLVAIYLLTARNDLAMCQNLF